MMEVESARIPKMVQHNDVLLLACFYTCMCEIWNLKRENQKTEQPIQRTLNVLTVQALSTTTY